MLRPDYRFSRVFQRIGNAGRQILEAIICKIFWNQFSIVYTVIGTKTVIGECTFICSLYILFFCQEFKAAYTALLPPRFSTQSHRINWAERTQLAPNLSISFHGWGGTWTTTYLSHNHRTTIVTIYVAWDCITPA